MHRARARAGPPRAPRLHRRDAARAPRPRARRAHRRSPARQRVGRRPTACARSPSCGARVTVAVDSEATIDAAARNGIREVLVDVNVGIPRCGVARRRRGRARRPRRAPRAHRARHDGLRGPRGARARPAPSARALTDESMAILAARARSGRRPDPLRRRHRHLRRQHRRDRDPGRFVRADGHCVREARHPVRARARGGRDRDPHEPEVVGRRLRAQGARHGPRQPDDRRRRSDVLLRRARHVRAAPRRCASATACSCGPRTSTRPSRTTTRCTSPTVPGSTPP